MNAVPGRRLSRGQFAWAFFDWANQPYFTLVLTFIFSPYFATRVVGDAVAGQSLWGYLQAGAGLAIALSSPVLGAVADATGRRKPWCAAFGVAGALATALLWTAVPGGPLLFVGAMAVLATIGFEIAIVFNNAFLPGLTVPERRGWLSGVGWGLGYLGGLVALAIILAGFYLPAEPWLGLDKSAGEDARIVGPFAALWFALFSLPFFLWTSEPAGARRAMRESVKHGLKTLAGTLFKVRHYRTVFWYLLARMIYADGLVALFGFGGIFAAGTFGWETREMGVFGIVILVFSALGSFPGAWADDRFGSRPTVLTGLIGLILAVLFILSLGEASLLFGFVPTVPAGAVMTTAPEIAMIAAAAVIGFCVGPVQAASRTLMVRLTPPQMSAEFFGLYAFSGKATAFTAPFLVGLSTDLFDTQRAALVVVLVFLCLGGALLVSRVKEPERTGP